MRNSGTVTQVPQSTRDEAVEWFVAFCEGEVGPAACRSFEAWLKVSPENVRAYLQVSAFWEAAGALNEGRKLAVDELVRRAAEEANVIPLASGVQSQPREAGTGLRRRLAMRVAAAALMLVVLGGVFAIWQAARYPEYRTQVGEERTITLSDGSVVELNARSRLRIEYREPIRQVRLLDGQALFRVAKNAARPFVVVSGTTQVRAVGTQFDVYRKPAGTIVTVVEGQVAVSDVNLIDSVSSEGAARQPAGLDARQGTRSRVLLAAGDQLRVYPHAVSLPTHTNPVAATAWTQGKLIFDSASISEVLEEVNRYTPRPLSIDDPKILSMHVSGTFSTTDSAPIIQFLSERFGLVAHESADGVQLSPQ